MYKLTQPEAGLCVGSLLSPAQHQLAQHLQTQPAQLKNMEAPQVHFKHVGGRHGTSLVFLTQLALKVPCRYDQDGFPVPCLGTAQVPLHL